MTDDAWPTEIRLSHDKRILTVSYDDGVSSVVPAELARVMSPSAEVQGHSAAERQTVAGKRDVTIRVVEPVGNYAVRLIFDDGHSTGIFTWGYLRKLGTEQDQLWRIYLDELAAKGLSRDR